MKRPAWATAVGVIGIIWGSLGTLGAVLTMLMPIFMPKLLMEAQRQMPAGQQNSEFLRMMTQLWNTPYLRNSCLFLGLIGILVSGFFVFASARLLQMRRPAIKLIYSALCIEILFNVLLLPENIVLKVVNILSGVVIYIVLLFIVAAGDKQAFNAAGSSS
ncbi:MAG: hypothetical protein WC317_07315 [Candidatus Omnitrophota bacterium]|jgi:hypothetical protein